MKAIHDFVEQKVPEIWKDDGNLTAEGFEVLLSVPLLIQSMMWKGM
jgi:hypothetical protein